MREWLYALIEEQLRRHFFDHPQVKAALPAIEEAVTAGILPPTAAAHQLLNLLD